MYEERPRKRRRWPLIVFFLIVCLVFFGPVLLLSFFLSSATPAIEKNSVLEIPLGRSISEGPGIDFWSEIRGEQGVSLWNLRRVLRAAARDDRIAAVQFVIRNFDEGWGTAEEILQEMDRFRESGKPVFVRFESDLVTDLDYFLATGADRIWVPPETGVLVNGLAAEVTFWRGTLEKLRVKPEVIMFKEYKSAGERFQNYEMSPYMREALAAVLERFDECFRKRVVSRRGIDEGRLREFMNRGVAGAEDLREAGMVDRLGYKDEIEKELADLAETDEYHGVSFSGYLSSLTETPPDSTRTIAVVFGEGPIVTGGEGDHLFRLSKWVLKGPVVASHIREAAEDKNVAAIVFRVNSPGGAAVGSDLVRREVQRASEKGKPVVVSMSSVAGSGGYWISMDADGIVAHPTTITGSIGVIFARLNFTHFLEMIGAHIDSVTTTPLADILGSTPLDGERRRRLEEWLGRVYESFTNKVAEARGLSPEEVEKIARGRIWSGSDALRIGLVDRLGGLEEAIRFAKELANLDPEKTCRLQVYPKPKSLIEQLLEGDWLVETPRFPSQKALLGEIKHLSRSRVLALMPEIRIH